MTVKNQTLINIRERSSIRAYTRELLTKEEMDILKDAVLAAPTARDRQQLRYSFITDETIIRKIDARIFHYCDSAMKKMLRERNADSFFYGAPCAVVITGTDTSWSDLDAGIAVQTLAIAAQSMGLSSVILGMPRLAFKADDPDNCRELMRMEEDERFCVAIAIGHAATTKKPHVHNPRLIRDFN
ncbi:MAG: nitroreductase family protein [Clostridiaceae bacterium]|nr:nitroreductase family protein [Clostridiaceae bacterium]